MICKRYGFNPHVKLWNKELINLFEFQSLNNMDSKGEADKDKSRDSINTSQTSQKHLQKKIDDLDQSHLKDIMNKKVLLPIPKIVEDWETNSKEG